MSNFLEYLDDKIKEFKIEEDYQGTHKVSVGLPEVTVLKNPITKEEIDEIINDDMEKATLNDFEEYWPGVKIGIVSNNEAYFWPTVYSFEDVAKALHKTFVIQIIYSKEENKIFSASRLSDEQKNMLLNLNVSVQRKHVSYGTSRQVSLKTSQSDFLDIFPAGATFAGEMQMPVNANREKERAILQTQEYNWYLDKKLALLNSIGGNDNEGI